MTEKVMELPSKLPRGRVLAQDRLFPDGGVYVTWQARVPAGTDKADLLNGEFWTRHIRALHSGDRISYLFDDMTRVGELLVVHQDIAGELQVVELWAKDLPGVMFASRRRGALEIFWAGQHERWCIRRDGDGVILAKNIASAAEAERRTVTDFVPRKLG